MARESAYSDANELRGILTLHDLLRAQLGGAEREGKSELELRINKSFSDAILSAGRALGRDAKGPQFVREVYLIMFSSSYSKFREPEGFRYDSIIAK